MKTYPLIHPVLKALIFIAALLFSVHIRAEQYPVERIHIHIQKNIFISGEALSYKIYCLNAKTEHLSQTSSVAYVEMINESGTPVHQECIILKNGMGAGGFLIEPNLPTGNYTLNAYTHWMKSISPQLTGIAQIFIFNIAKTEPQSSPDSPLLSNAAPEKPLEILLNSYWGESYDTIHFEISLGKEQLFNENRYQFQLFSKRKREKIIPLVVKNEKQSIAINTKELLPGNYGVCITNLKDSTVACQSFHLADSSQRKQHLKNRLLKKIRQRVSVPIQLTDFSQQQDTFYLSATVRMKEPEQLCKTSDMVDFRSISLDFGAQDQSRFQKKINAPLSNWTSQQGIIPLWCKLALKQNSDQIRYPEKEAYILEGKVITEDSLKTRSNTMVYLAKIGGFAEIYPCRSNLNGQFYFELPLDSKLHDIALQVTEQPEQELTFQLKEKFRGTGIPPVKWKKTTLQQHNLDYLKLMWENYEIRKLHHREQFIPRKDTSILSAKRNFFDKPFFSVNISKYIKLDSLEEYFHELVPQVSVKYKKNKYNFHIFNPDMAAMMKEKPLVLYDGIIVDNYNEVMNKKVQNIERIEVVPYEYYYQSAHFNGIIHIISKNQKGELTNLPNNTERYYLPLFTQNIEKKPFDFTSEITHMPDFRTDLLWEPNIEIHKNKNYKLEFYTSDVKGEYELIIEGISAKGKPVSYVRTIIVE